MRLGKGQPSARRVGLPDCVGVAGTSAHRHGGDNGRLNRARKIDSPLPLLLRQHAAKARGRRRWRVVPLSKIRRIGPGAAYAQKGRRQCLGQQAQIGEIDRGTIFIKIGVHASRHPLFTTRRGAIRAGGFTHGAIGLPEPAAGHLEHFDVEGLIALMHLANALHHRRSKLDDLTHCPPPFSAVGYSYAGVNCRSVMPTAISRPTSSWTLTGCSTMEPLVPPSRTLTPAPMPRDASADTPR